jgi:hypothetical protein
MVFKPDEMNVIPNEDQICFLSLSQELVYVHIHVGKGEKTLNFQLVKGSVIDTEAKFDKGQVRG